MLHQYSDEPKVFIFHSSIYFPNRKINLYSFRTFLLVFQVDSAVTRYKTFLVVDFAVVDSTKKSSRVQNIEFTVISFLALCFERNFLPYIKSTTSDLFPLFLFRMLLQSFYHFPIDRSVLCIYRM